MAVYTDVSREALTAFLAGYDLGELVAYTGIAEGVENSNFKLETTRTTLILTLYEKRVAEADLPFFLGLMEHLAEGGLVCPTPVHDRKGAALGRLAGRPAAMVTFLQGKGVPEPGVEHCRQVGGALAQLHRLGADFAGKRVNALSVPGWRKLAADTRDRADEVEAGLAAGIAAELAWLEERWPAELPVGVIHADLFTDNVFFRNDRLSGIIDFYFACTDLIAYDVAVTLNAWCFEVSGELDRAKAKALVEGYEVERRLSPAERDALPVLIRGAALRFLLTRLYDWLNHPEGALVRPKDPLEYWRRLKIQQSFKTTADYGI